MRRIGLYCLSILGLTGALTFVTGCPSEERPKQTPPGQTTPESKETTPPSQTPPGGTQPGTTNPPQGQSNR